MKILGVGEAPGPRPSEVSLREFEARIPGISRMEIAKVFDEWPGRDGKGSAFPMKEARVRAAAIWKEHSLERPFLFIGRRCSRAFGLSADTPFCSWMQFHGRRIAIVPHPSGVVTWWQNAVNLLTVERFMEAIKEEL